MFGLEAIAMLLREVLSRVRSHVDMVFILFEGLLWFMHELPLMVVIVKERFDIDIALGKFMKRMRLLGNFFLHLVVLWVPVFFTIDVMVISIMFIVLLFEVTMARMFMKRPLLLVVIETMLLSISC